MSQRARRQIFRPEGQSGDLRNSVAEFNLYYGFTALAALSISLATEFGCDT
jgi:hypothetical protein